MVQVLEWTMTPGANVPKPRLKDDAGRFPVEVVRQVRDWLVRISPGFDLHKPTPIRIVMGPKCESAQIIYGLEDLSEVQPGYGQHIFIPGSIEVLFREKRKGPIIAKFRYLAAQTPESRIIVGPELGMIQEDRPLITL